MLNSSRIVIPTHDNDGSSNAAIIDSAIRNLTAEFGGATAWDARGYWIASEGTLYAEPVTVIESAVVASDDAEAKLRALAASILSSTDQLAVYVQFPGGRVEIIEKP